MDQRMKDRLWKEREMRMELAHEDTAQNRKIMADIYRRRAEVREQRFQQFQKELRERQNQK